MGFLVAALVGLLVFSGGFGALLRARPRWLTAVRQRMLGAVMLGLALFVLLRGQWEVALPLAMAGLSLAGLMQLPQRFGGAAPVTTPMLSARLGRGGRVEEGVFTRGPFAGRSFGSLRRGEIAAARSSLDGHSRSVLDMYLDGLRPGWREDGQADAHGGDGRGVGLTEHEAYEILGLQPGASDEMIRQAHRTLMVKVHPDQGGTTYLATRVNQARDILLTRHRRNS